MPRIASLFFAGVVCLAAVMTVVVIARSTMRDDPHTTRDDVTQLAQSGRSTLVVDLAKDPEGESSAEGSFTRSTTDIYPVIIRKPTGPPRIELAGTDPQGRSGSVACSTCHAVRKPNIENVSAATLDEFHQGMSFNHGKITCYACHNPGDADSLHLADGTLVTYPNVMTLCSQCHGPQATAFAHGAHGGMNGHWDLTRGPQMKNNCIDCHDPHAPNYPKMIVGFKPKDRFNAPSEHSHKEEVEH